MCYFETILIILAQQQHRFVIIRQIYKFEVGKCSFSVCKFTACGNANACCALCARTFSISKPYNKCSCNTPGQIYALASEKSIALCYYSEFVIKAKRS